MVVDFHTHRSRCQGECAEIISVHPGRHLPLGWFTIGYHPWWNTKPLTDEELWILKDHIHKQPGCLAIGECGLDKLKGPQLPIQLAILHQQVDIANELNVPVIVHCVRSFHEVKQIRREKGKTPWVVHGFVRNKDLAKQLLDLGFYLSIALGEKRTVVFEEMARYIPLDRVFLETDSDPMLTIQGVYQNFCRLRNVHSEELEQQILNNIFTFFAWKSNHLRIGLNEQNS